MGENFYLSLSPEEKRYFSLPRKWTAVHFLESTQAPAEQSVREMTREALAKPIGFSSLREMVSGGKRVAVIVDDGTRPTPASEILAVLLPHLVEAGCPKEAATIVMALGTHAPMSKEELEKKLGADVTSAYRVVQHNAWQDDLVPVKIPGDARLLKVNPAVAEADLRIGISSILPHPMAGYGGGPKLLMPGVSNIDFVMHHHMKNAIHPLSKVGITKGNPFHEECMSMAKVIGLDVTIDCVYDREGRIFRVIAGGLEAAFAEAVKACSEVLGHPFPEKVDISITSSYPHTHGIQFYKGLAAADVVTKPQGAIVVVAPMATPVPDEFVKAFIKVKEEAHDDTVSYVCGFMSQGRPYLPSYSAEFNLAMSFAIRRPRIRTVIVSPLITRDTAEVLGLEYSPTLDGALALLGRAYPEARAAIFPSGGLIVPIVGWEG
ncbi:MAG TPA: lactate racemase domain-containing protein [Syntrophorhabdales bacterium]|nr:lactate racemase domain-containing protein [Syntrophorhabdales bacterium]